MRTGKRSWRGVAGLAVLLALVGAAPAAAAAAGGAKTRTETVDPWTAGGKLKPGVMIAGDVKGTCWTSSIAVASSEAYRCMTAKSLIYDPCLAPPAKTVTQLACMASPWGKVTLFELTAPIATSAKHANGKPWVWAYQLGNGVRCITATGTGTLVDKVALNYYCVPGTGWAAIPDKTTEPWTARYAKSPRSKTLKTEKVTTAWY
jgi:hypothetical protein